MTQIRILIAFALILPANFATANSDTLALMLSNGCVNCHGTEGRGSPYGNIPPLNGRSRDFLETTMKSFKSGARQSTIMNRIMKDLDDERIAFLAIYFSSIKYCEHHE